jgi:hypothetical protein
MPFGIRKKEKKTKPKLNRPTRGPLPQTLTPVARPAENLSRRRSLPPHSLSPSPPILSPLPLSLSLAACPAPRSLPRARRDDPGPTPMSRAQQRRPSPTPAAPAPNAAPKTPAGSASKPPVRRVPAPAATRRPRQPDYTSEPAEHPSVQCPARPFDSSRLMALHCSVSSSPIVPSGNRRH